MLTENFEYKNSGDSDAGFTLLILQREIPPKRIAS